MSTKTTFKRVALVAVAALGLGVLSVAPSSATITNVTLTTVNGTASTTGVNDSSTAASIAINALATASDSFTVRTVLKSRPSTATVNPVQAINDTATSTGLTGSGYVVVGGTSSGVIGLQTKFNIDSTTVVTPASNTYGAVKILNFFDTSTSVVAGTYTYTAVVTPFNAGVAGTIVTKDFTIVVAAGAEDSKVASSTHSTAFLSLGNTSASSGQTVDSSVAVVATASAADVAEVNIILKNGSNVASKVVESVTATITGAGVIGLDGGTTYGKSILLSYEAAANMTLGVRADGTAGTGTITISTPSVSFAAKTVTFYAKSASTAVASVAKSVIESSGSATADTVRVAIKDANGATWAGAAYIYASSAADALIAGSVTPSACTFDPVDARHECDVTGKTVGTAKFKVIDADTVADATWTSNEVSVRVATSVPASFKLVFDKASYQPGEKAVLSVVPVDAAGAQMVGKTYTGLLATGGITSNIALGTGSDTLTATDIVVSATSSAASGTTAGQRNYTVYMPFASGDVIVTATGGTGLPAAARVAVTATASVVNSSVDAATDAANEATDAANAATDAALAAADAADAATAAAQDASDAVAALSASVSKLISSLRAQITSLTNLVIKIQKKVRA
jgi:trimeric autotransporter adhesin